MAVETLKCVYVVEHPRMNGLVKVGRSKNIKYRVSVLNTSVPEDFRVVLIYETNSYYKLEKSVIKRLTDEGLQRGARDTKEFFNCGVEHVKQVIDQIVAEHVSMTGSYLDDETIRDLLRRTR